MDRREFVKKGGLFGAIATVLGAGPAVIAQARQKVEGEEPEASAEHYSYDTPQGPEGLPAHPDDRTGELEHALAELKREYEPLEVLFSRCPDENNVGWNGGFHRWRPDYRGPGPKCSCGAQVREGLYEGLREMLAPLFPERRPIGPTELVESIVRDIRPDALAPMAERVIRSHTADQIEKKYGR